MLKVIILYRVIQNWRAPVFEKLSMDTSLDLQVWYGPDFPNTKVISKKGPYLFKSKRVFSFRFKANSRNGYIAFPVSPFLFFNLIVENPNVVVTEGASNLFNSLVAFFYCKIFRKKFVWWSLGKLVDRTYDSKRQIIDRAIRLVELNSDAIITYSTPGKDYYLSIGVPSERIYKAVNVVDTDAVFNKSKIFINNATVNNIKGKFERIVLFVGALEKEKSVELLLDAFKMIEVVRDDFLLILVGDGNHLTYLKEYSKKIDIHNILFTGRIIDENYIYFRIADLFVLPGLGGLAISEAMAYGLPVICSVGDGCEVDLIEDNGIIDRQITADRLFQHIMVLLEDPFRLKKMGDLSKNIIQTKYNIHTYLKSVKDAIFD
jgi:glycosyltransferase involved in cell wall biosynthesis